MIKTKYFSYLFLLSTLSFYTFAASFDQEIKNLKEKSYISSPNLKSLQYKSKESNASKIASLSNNLPNIYLNIKRQKNYFRSNNSLLQSLGLVTPTSVWSLDYQWSLFNYKSILNSRLKFNESNIDSIEYENGQKAYDVEFQTAFLNYVLSKYKLATISNSIKKAETSKKEANLGFELGQKTKIDVLRADANYVSLNSKRTSIEDEDQNAKSKLLEISGLIENDLNFLNNLKEEDYLSIIDQQSDYKTINREYTIDRSPTFEKLNLEIKKSNLESNLITSSEWPELKIQGAYESSGDSYHDTIYKPTRSHTVALVLTIPIFTGGSIISSNFEEYYAKKRLTYLSEQNIRQLDNNLKNTSIKISAMETLVKSLKINTDQFEELYKLTSKSYQLGKSTLFELLEVQDNLLDSKINLAANKIQLYNLVETFRWQSGQL